MLLEIGNPELLHVPRSLAPTSRVDEAVVVLQTHHAKGETAQKVGLLLLLPLRQGKSDSKAKLLLREVSSRFEGSIACPTNLHTKNHKLQI